MLTYPASNTNFKIARNSHDHDKPESSRAAPILTPTSMAGIFTPSTYPEFVSLYEDQKLASNSSAVDLTPQSTSYPQPEESGSSPAAHATLNLLPKYEKRKSSPAALETTLGFDEQPPNFAEPRNSIEAAMLLANFTRSPAFLSRTPSDKDIFGNKVSNWNDGFATPPPLPNEQRSTDIATDPTYKQSTSKMPTPTPSQSTNGPWRPMSNNPLISDEPITDLMRRHSYDVSTTWRNNQPAVDRETLLQMAGAPKLQSSTISEEPAENHARQHSAPAQTVFTFTSEDGSRISWMPNVSFEQASGPTTSFLSQPSPTINEPQDVMLSQISSDSLKRPATPVGSSYNVVYTPPKNQDQNYYEPYLPDTRHAKEPKAKKMRAGSPASESVVDDNGSENNSDEMPDMMPKDVEAAMNDPEARPRKQKLRFDGDQYTPKWVRYNGQAKEGLCDTCRPGKWLQLKNSAYWYHKQFFHGISSVSGKEFTDPVETRFVDKDLQEGLCHQCHQWIPVSNAKRKNTVLWYRHAHKCHVYNKPKGSTKKR